MEKLKYISFILLILIFTGCEEQKLDIDKFGSVTGIILDGESYSPLSGVMLATNPASSTILTDDAGKFEFTKIVAGDITITARKKDYLTSSVSIAVYDQEYTNITFFLLKDENEVGNVVIYDPVPGNGAVNQTNAITLKWNVDQENKGKDLLYTVYIFESNSTVQQIAGENLNSKEVTIQGLNENTSYYWYVVAKFEGSNVANSPTWTFKTGDITGEN